MVGFITCVFGSLGFLGMWKVVLGCLSELIENDRDCECR